ncbi:MAG: adenine nucleotide alpha hydrolase family protein [Thermoplasmata archaeon]|nr:adenine nucleotide alpha hydrolase family protein [Thermoplasmata archaeon]
MKCSRCHEEAVIYYPQSRQALCAEHLKEYIERKVKRAIERFKMLKRGEKVLVAVSGGKDSLMLWEILVDMGYDTEGLYIDLGLGEYSKSSEEYSRGFAEERDLTLRIVRVKEDHGIDIVAAAKRLRRPTCSVCGTVKRYIMNREAVEAGRVLATGHNMDDEASTLLGNLLTWNGEQLLRASPSLPSTHPKLARRIKPLIYVSERESATYCFSHGIKYIIPECPYSEGARLSVVKEALSKIEDRSPGSLLNFVDGFYRKSEGILCRRNGGIKEGVELKPCPLCGYLTSSSGPCAFCRLKSLFSSGE